MKFSVISKATPADLQLQLTVTKFSLTFVGRAGGDDLEGPGKIALPEPGANP
jgi:hypothetical protein